MKFDEMKEEISTRPDFKNELKIFLTVKDLVVSSCPSSTVN